LKHIKKIALIFSILLVVVLYISYMIQPVENFSSFLEKYEEFDTYVSINENPLVYEVSKNGEKIGYLGIDGEKGYQSTIKMAVLIDNNSQIINVKVVDQGETPAFFLRISNSAFFNQFKEKPIVDGFKVGENIDAVSNATVSSSAMTKAIHKSVNYIGAKYLNTKVANVYSGFEFKTVDFAIIMMFILVLAANKFKNKHLRTLILLYSIIILGFKFSTFVTYTSFFQIITGNFPSLTENLWWYLLIIGSILLVVFSGKNLFCLYICPFGSLQELEYKLAKIPFKISPQVRKILKLLPFVLAYLSLVLVLTTEKIGAISYEPFARLFSGSGLDIQWALIFIVLFSGLAVFRPYCNFVCPVGLVFRTLAEVKRLGVKLWKRKSG